MGSKYTEAQKRATAKPYIRRLSEKIYLTQEMNVELKSMM